jgi:hypothetical protein
MSAKTRKAPEGALSMNFLKWRNWSGLVDAFLIEGIGAGEGIRTLDPNLGKVVLYP